MSWEVALLIALLMLSLVVPLGRALVRAAEEARRAELEERRHRPPVSRSEGGRTPVRRPRVPETARRVHESTVVSRRRQLTVVADPAVMRRGMVLMTVLGPCRGLEPFDQFPRGR